MLSTNGFRALGAVTLVLLACTLILLSKPAHAKVFKCVDDAGSVTYMQVPCPIEHKASVISRGIATRTRSAQDCGIANNFAMKTAIDMRRGRSSDGLFSAYGGLNSIPGPAISIISYVYSHQKNANVSSERIAALSAARCESEAFGRVSCENFPRGFISELGGCDAAAQVQNFNDTQQRPLQTSQPQAPMNQPDLGLANTGQAASAPDRQAICRQSVDEQLAELHDQMRQRQSASSQSNLQQQRVELRRRKSRC